MNKYKGRELWYQEYYKRNKEIYKQRQNKRLYKVTPEQISALHILQNNTCAICGKIFTSTPHVDHDHLTNEVRGLLCRRCNTGLGYYEKFNVKFKEYLNEYPSKRLRTN